MPLKTFLNLPETRKKEIINICLEEFSRNDYESTSLSTIIKKLNLAKGSFYRYFKSKKDLYFFLIETLGKIIWPYAEEILKKGEKSFIESWRDYYIALIHIEKEYPFYLRFLFKIRSEQNLKLIKDSRFKKSSKRFNFIKDLLEAQHALGYLRTDVDIDLLTLVFGRMISVLFDYLSLKYNLDLGDNSKTNQPISSIDEEIIKKEIDSFLLLIQGVFINPEKQRRKKL